METRLQRLLPGFVFLICLFNTEVYSEDINFNHITTQDGLSGNIVRSLYRDSRGYLWIGCENGLNRYDGYHILTYSHNPRDTATIFDNNVSDLIEDEKRNLWVATKNGVCQFNYETESFTRVFNAAAENTFNQSLHLTRRNELFLITTHGVYLFDKEKKEFTKFFSSNIDDASACMTDTKEDFLVIGTWIEGIIVVHPNRSDYYVGKLAAHMNERELNSIESITEGADGKIYLATQFGVVTADIASVNGKIDIKMDPLFNSEKTPGKITNDAAHTLLAIDNDIWIGTEFGLNIYNTSSGKVTQILSQEGNSKSLSNNLITDIYQGVEGEVWIGTYQGGVNQFSKSHFRFKDQLPFINKSTERGVRYVKAIHQQPDGTYWLGTDYGLLCFAPDFTYIKSFTHSQKAGSIGEGGINSIFLDSRNQLWLGNWGGGVNLYQENTSEFIQYSRYLEINVHDSLFAGDWNVRTMIEDSLGYIWIAYMFGILDRFDPLTQTFKHFDLRHQTGYPNLYIRSMKLDKKSCLWIGTSGSGLIKFDTKTKQANVFHPKKGIDNEEIAGSPGIDIYSVTIDTKGLIWLGTGNGLCILDPEDESFLSYSTERGLASQTVLNIVFDHRQNPWLSTLKGISKFDQKTGIFINYDEKDGVLPNAENGYISRTGLLLFGGVNGINVFNPDSIWENSYQPPVVFTDLRIYNKTVTQNKTILSKNIDEIKQINLKHRQNDITIGFAALSFINPEKNIYKYMLEGYDKEWVYGGTNKEAKYTNLDPGKYTFKVIAANNDGVWSNVERKLILSIRPPWWSTLFFRLTLIVLLIAGFFAIISIRTYRLKQQRQKLIEMVEERTSEIETQRKKLEKQSKELQKTNLLLIERQEKIGLQKEAIEQQNLKLEEKNKLLEDQKSEILKQKSEVEKMAAKLHRSDQMKLKFFTNVSHEFRTPLSLIILPVKNILSEIKSSENLHLLKNINIIHRNSLRLQRLINQFLDLSKIENGVLKLSVAKGEVRKYIEEIIEVYQYIADQRNIELCFLSDYEGECYFDGDKIEKILYNLLFNAFKFTENDGKINVSLQECMINQSNGKGRPGICIIVEDTGRGIEPEKQQKIFERFYQVEEKGGSSSGTGIGLSLSLELIKIYHGKIELESAPGKGSKFIISLPSSVDSFKKSEIKGESSALHPVNEIPYDISFDIEDDAGQILHKNISGKSSILIIEDNIDTRHFLKDQLKGVFHIFLAADGQEGLKKAFSLSPDIILSDIMMPTMNGYQLCEQLKNDERTCHIPIVLLTALAQISDQMEGIEYGADEYIVKPFDIDLLKLKLHKLVESRNKLKHYFHRHIMFPPEKLEINSADEKLMKKVMNILEKDIADPEFGVDSLSKKVGLSRTHLYRKLKEITSQSPVEFIRNTRLQRAAYMLKENKLYVSEVAYMCGFNEISYFRKMFKDFYGVSPVEYINNYKSA